MYYFSFLEAPLQFFSENEFFFVINTLQVKKKKTPTSIIDLELVAVMIQSQQIDKGVVVLHLFNVIKYIFGG